MDSHPSAGYLIYETTTIRLSQDHGNLQLLYGEDISHLIMHFFNYNLRYVFAPNTLAISSTGLPDIQYD